jgi:hypothetical protein
MLKYYIKDLLDFQDSMNNSFKKDIKTINIKEAIEEVIQL